MRYDLDLVNQLCREIGLPARMDTDSRVEIDLGRGAVLCFQNAEREEDCLIGFLGMPWHTHDDLMFVDARGNYINLDYRLVHSEHNDEFKYLKEGKRIIVRRATIQAAETSKT